jgi:GTPase SAR1 family protein
MAFEDGKFNEGKSGVDGDEPVIQHLAPSNMSAYTDLTKVSSSHVPRLVLRCKVSIVGDPGVGKSALSQMMHSGGHMFPKNYVMTTGVDFAVKVRG